MQNLSNKIQQYLNKDKRNKKYRLLALALSFVVAFSVFGSLIMPAISMSRSSVMLSAGTMSMPDSFTDFSWDNLSSYVDLNDKIVSDNGTPVVINQGDVEGNPDAVKALIQFKYKLDNGQVSSSSSKYVYLELDENVKLADGKDIQGKVTDEAYTSDSSISGDYYLTTHNGKTYLVIKFTDNYLEHCGSVGVQGGAISFSAIVERGEDENGTESSISIGNVGNVTVPGFTNKELKLDKSGTYNSDNGTITWTVTVENQAGEDLNGCKLTDSMMSGAAVTFDPSTTTDSNGNTVSFGSLNENGEFVFDENSKYMKDPITFSYTTTLSDTDLQTPTYDGSSQGVKKNKVQLVDGSETDKVTPVEKEIYYNLGYSISDKTYTTTENGLEWTIKIANTYNKNLTGFKIKDDAFSNLKTGTAITLTEGVTGTVSDGVLTLTDTRSTYGDLEIKYTTDPVEGTEGNNKAELIPPDSDKVISSKECWWNTKYVTVDKDDGIVDKTNQEITWKVYLKDTGGTDFNGYKVQDAMLKHLIDGSLKVTYRYQDSETISSDCYTYDKETGTITFNEKFAQYYDTDDLTIVYKVSYDSTKEDHVDASGQDGDSKYYKNTAYLYHGDTQVGESYEKTATVAPTNEVSKSKQSATENKDEEGNVTSLTVNWKVYLKQDPGTFGNWTLTDKDLTADNNASHTITEDQLNALYITVAKENEWNYSQLDNTDNQYYTVKKSESGGFTLEFTSKFGTDYPNYDKAEIYFATTVDLSGVTPGTKVSYSNTASYHDKDSTPTDIYELKEPIDTSKTPYEKYNVSDGAKSNGENSVKLNKNSLPKVTVDGVEYYLFKYKIVFNKDNTLADDFTIVDTLPDGFTLYPEVLNEDNQVDTSYSGRIKCYRYCYNYWEYLSTTTSKNDYGVYAESGTNKVYFNLKNYYQGKQVDIYYNVIVPVSELNNKLANGEFTFTNTINGGEYDSVSNTTTVINTGEPVITKSGSNNQYLPGSYEYVVDINPEGKNLTSNNGKLTITDIMKSCEPYNGIGSGSAAFQAELTSINLYEVKSDGTRGDEVDCNIDTDLNPTNTVVTYPTFTSEGNGTWTCEQSFSVGSTVVIKLKAPESFNTSDTFSFDIKKKESWGWSNLTQVNNCSYTNGYYEYTLTITDDLKNGIQINSYRSSWNDTQNEIIPAEATMTLTEVQTPYVAKITASGIPDGKHLQLVYTYKCWRDTDSTIVDDECGITNSATLTIPGDTVLTDGDKTAESKDTITLKNSTSATSETAKSFALEKVAVGHNNLLLSAGFELYQYVNTESYTGWQAANSFTANETSGIYEVGWSSNESGAVQITTKENEKLKVNLEQGVLYMLKEVQEPTVEGETYIKLTDPVYFCYVTDPENLPDGITSNDYKKVISNNSILVKNAKYIDIGVTKNWVGASWDDFQSVTVQLYRSLKEYTDGFPAEGEYEVIGKNSEGKYVADDGRETLTTEFKLSSSDKFTFTDLPNGNEKGEKYYYYVKEIAVTDKSGTTKSIADSEYKPKYSTYAMSVEDSEVTITNASTLIVQKVWKDQNNQVIQTPPVSEVTFDLYSSTTQLSNSYPDDSKLTLVKEGIKVTAADGWSVSVMGSDGKPLPDKDSDGNTLYYYVKESTISGYSATYWPTNGTTADGTAIMTNTFSLETMNMKLSKQWSDSDTVNHSGDTLSFNVYRSTNAADVPTNVNTFISTGGGSAGGTISFELYNASNELEAIPLRVSGQSSFTNVSKDDVFDIAVLNGYFNGKQTAQRIDVINLSGTTVATYDKNQITSGLIGNYCSISNYISGAWGSDSTLTITVNTNESLTFKLYMDAGASYCNYTVTKQGNSGGNTPVVDPITTLNKASDPYHGSDTDSTFWKTVTLTADNSWSADIELEKTDSSGNLYYYWIEETKLGTTDIGSTKYTAYYRYNGTDGTFSISGNDASPAVEVYNNAETNTGSLPETGGTGTTPYKAAGAAISCTAAVLLVSKRRKTATNKK